MYIRPIKELSKIGDKKQKHHDKSKKPRKFLEDFKHKLNRYRKRKIAKNERRTKQKRYKSESLHEKLYRIEAEKNKIYSKVFTTLNDEKEINEIKETVKEEKLDNSHIEKEKTSKADTKTVVEHSSDKSKTKISKEKAMSTSKGYHSTRYRNNRRKYPFMRSNHRSRSPFATTRSNRESVLRTTSSNYRRTSANVNVTARNYRGNTPRTTNSNYRRTSPNVTSKNYRESAPRTKSSNYSSKSPYVTPRSNKGNKLRTTSGDKEKPYITSEMKNSKLKPKPDTKFKNTQNGKRSNRSDSIDKKIQQLKNKQTRGTKAKQHQPKATIEKMLGEYNQSYKKTTEPIKARARTKQNPNTHPTRKGKQVLTKKEEVRQFKQGIAKTKRTNKDIAFIEYEKAQGKRAAIQGKMKDKER